MDGYIKLIVAEQYDDATQYAIENPDVRFDGGIDIRYKSSNGYSLGGRVLVVEHDSCVNLYNIEDMSLREIDDILRGIRLKAKTNNGKFKGFIAINFYKHLTF